MKSRLVCSFASTLRNHCFLSVEAKEATKNLGAFLRESDLVGRPDLRFYTVWFLVGNGGMGYGDYYWGLDRGYYRDPFPHSLLSTGQYRAMETQPENLHPLREPGITYLFKGLYKEIIIRNPKKVGYSGSR